MGREFELKYKASPESMAALEAAFDGFIPIAMETAYYDTFDGKLQNQHWTLRRRLENGKSIVTLKTPAADGSRNEWEAEAQSVMTGIPMLCKLGAPIRLMELTVNGVVTVCGAKFTRLAKTISLENATVELALDRGKLLGGGRELALQEVEVELKAGSEAAALAFAGELAEQFGLVPEEKSKYRRALGLAWGERA